MADETTLFRQDPWAYINTKLVNNSRPIQAIWCSLVGPKAKQKSIAQDILTLIDQGLLENYGFQFVALKHNGVTNVMLRPDVTHFLDEIRWKHINYNLKVRAQYNKLLPYMWRMRAFWPSSLTAYYFPYKTTAGYVTCAEDMGYVDFPKVNPPHKFVFTGGMQGCHLVVTSSPKGANYLRAWHYQSPSSNPLYLPKHMGRGRFPGYVYDWLTNEEYEYVGGRRYLPQHNDFMNEEVNAFNFLHYHDEDHSWWLYSQPQKIVQENHGLNAAWYVTWSRLEPFRRKITVGEEFGLGLDDVVLSKWTDRKRRGSLF
jgi:hypothetical protein